MTHSNNPGKLQAGWLNQAGGDRQCAAALLTWLQCQMNRLSGSPGSSRLDGHLTSMHMQPLDRPWSIELSINRFLSALP